MRMTCAAVVLMPLLLAGCSGGSADPPPAQAAEPSVNPSPTPSPAPAPTVNAGPDQIVKLGTPVKLSGSSTTTESHPNYLWQFISVPAGSGATLKDAATLTPTFSPDLPGLYVASLSLDGGPNDSVSIDVKPNLLTLRFSGTFGSDGTVEGTFTYEITQGPNATNVRSLQPNVMYRLTSWHMVVNSGQVANLLPSTVFDSAEPDNTAEFCEGICLFSSPPLVELRFHNTGPDMLQLTFQHADPTPLINPPASLAEWGAHLQSTYRVPNDVPLAVLNTGSLTEG